MSNAIKYLPYSEVTQLQGNIENNLNIYADDAKDFASTIDIENIKLTVNAKISSELKTKIKLPTNPKQEDYDAHNSALVYESIDILPMHACDERIWIYLSHFDLRHYVMARWPMPKDEKKHATHIRSHYFVHGSRGLSRNNGIARLWWMGYAASRSKKFQPPEKALNILCFESDVRANFLERNLSMNPDVFDAVLSLLERDYNTAKNKTDAGKKKEEAVKGTLLQRNRFRGFMKSLNQIGGYRMLDVLSYNQLLGEVKKISKISP